MPYDEDKQQGLEVGKVMEQSTGEFKLCTQCKKSFKMGDHPDKPGKKTELNEDGSRHKKIKFPQKQCRSKAKNIVRSTPPIMSSIPMLGRADIN